MNYKPRNSNFDEMQDQFSEEIEQACRAYRNGLESLKDVVAKQIDLYLDAIMEEQLKERHFFAYSDGKVPVMMFSLGENKLPDGQVDGFYTERPLADVLDDLVPLEIDEAEDAGRIALMFENVAAKFRERERLIPIEHARWDKEHAERLAALSNAV